MKENKIYIVDGGFLQSSDWINFQQSFGKKVFRIEEKDSYLANAIENKLPLVGSYLFVPRGPIFLQKDKQRECFEKLVRETRKNRSVWFRIESQSKDDLEAIQEIAKEERFLCLKSKKNHQPSQTLIVDIAKSEEELLAEMKSKTRYNINLAKRKGVKIAVDHSKKAVDIFVDLSIQTAKRDGIVIHPEEYYRKMLEQIPHNKLSLYIAKFEEKVIATALVSFAGDVATYLHGASSNENRNVMAPYFLQWHVICDAKKRGFKRYDFGGTKIEYDENNKLKRNSWSGITRFKLGFCPKTKPVEFPGCWDIVIDKKKYYTYKVLQNLKDVLRKLKIK